MNTVRAIYTFVLDVAETIVIAMAMFVVVYLFAFQPHQIKGDSMLPDFVDGEYLMTNKLVYYFREPQRGDVIVFKFPMNHQFDYIKRIIGLPGEELMLKDNHVVVFNDKYPDGLPLQENYLERGATTTGRAFLSENRRVRVPDDEYFVMGDNRERSSDSREWGFVPEDNIIGKSWIRYWPTSAMAFIPEQEYE